LVLEKNCLKDLDLLNNLIFKD
jgi:hypothetical protein